MQQAWDKNGRIYYIDDNGNKVQPKSTLNAFERLGMQAKAGLGNLNRWLQNADTNSQSYKDKVNLTLGLLTAPIGGSSALAAKGAGALTPFVGKKIAQNIASGAVGGATGGAVEGFGRGIVEQKNPIKTAVQDGTIGLVTGALGGAAGGKIGQVLDRRALGNNTIAPEQYFADYVEGLSNNTPINKVSRFQKALGDFKMAREGNSVAGTGTLFDLISGDDFKKWFGKSKVVDNEGKPLLLRDDDNVFITDGYSNNGISKYTYKGSHRAPSSTITEGTPEYRAENSYDMNLNEVLQGLSPQPDDYFSPNGARWYGYDDAEGLESFNAIRKVKNGADKITAYRAVSDDVNSDVLNNGDWITFSPKYAKLHGDTNLNGKYKIIQQEVSPNDVWWDGNDIREWGYDNGLPQDPDLTLQIENPYRQATLPEDWMAARAIRNQGYDGIITDDGKYLVFEKDQIKRTSDVENYNSLFKKIIEKENKPIIKEVETLKKEIPPYKESNYFKQRQARLKAKQ